LPYPLPEQRSFLGCPKAADEGSPPSWKGVAALIAGNLAFHCVFHGQYPLFALDCFSVKDNNIKMKSSFPRHFGLDTPMLKAVLLALAGAFITVFLLSVLFIDCENAARYSAVGAILAAFRRRHSGQEPFLHIYPRNFHEGVEGALRGSRKAFGQFGNPMLQ
jgi:hypothetical protein